jgi:hypothetical protein
MSDSSSESPQEIEAPAQEIEKPADVEASETLEPLTIEQLKKDLDRAKDAGLRPLQIAAAAYLKKITDAVEGFLGGLEGDSQEKKK